MGSSGRTTGEHMASERLSRHADGSRIVTVTYLQHSDPTIPYYRVRIFPVSIQYYFDLCSSSREGPVDVPPRRTRDRRPARLRLGRPVLLARRKLVLLRFPFHLSQIVFSRIDRSRPCRAPLLRRGALL